jgi:hypothetical protein
MAEGLRALRSNQKLLYAVAGAASGAVGAVFAEIILDQDSMHASELQVIAESGLWTAAFASILGLTLFIAGEWYQRHDLKPTRGVQVLGASALAGLVSGAAAQYLYNLDISSFEVKYYALRIVAWSLMGAILGALLSRAVPNLGLARGTSAGAIGGAIGCMGFLLAGMALPGFAGRIIGITLLGLSLGLAMYFVESMAREARVEVEWAPYETSSVSLGPKPIFIGGGGEEHIFKKGLPPEVSCIVFKDGLIEHIETATGKRTPLQDGSRLRIGGLMMVVHASAPEGSASRSQNRYILVAVVATVLVATAAFTLWGPVP